MSQAGAPSGPILVVDDDIWNIRIVTLMLKEGGYPVLSTQDPFQALPLIRAHRPRLVLLDLNMPGMDGLSLLPEIRKESDVPVVMLTSDDKAEFAVRALRQGAYDYLTKPVEHERLLETVSAAIASGAAVENRIAQYELAEEVGRGGMGVVYAARDTRLTRRVALKVLLPQLAADGEYERRFLREAKTAAQFAHRNIVTVYDAGRYRGRLYLAMELVEGLTVQHLIRNDPPPAPRTMVLIGLQVARAMEAVHDAGLVHRDIKPSNLMLTYDSSVKILDFGLARPLRPSVGEPTTETGTGVCGTLQYVAPELLDKGSTSAQTDIYALGVVLYELLAGQPAFHSDSQFRLMLNIIEGRVSKPWSELAGALPDLLALVRRMMAVSPADRPGSMREVSSALGAILERLPR